MLSNTFVTLFIFIVSLLNNVFGFLFVVQLHYAHLAGVVLVIEHIGAIKARENTDFAPGKIMQLPSPQRLLW